MRCWGATGGSIGSSTCSLFNMMSRILHIGVKVMASNRWLLGSSFQMAKRDVILVFFGIWRTECSRFQLRSIGLQFLVQKWRWNGGIVVHQFRRQGYCSTRLVHLAIRFELSKTFWKVFFHNKQLFCISQICLAIIWICKGQKKYCQSKWLLINQ